jgi:PAS domain S-box-containing protein
VKEERMPGQQAELDSVLAVFHEQAEARPDQLRIAQQLIEVLPIPVFFKARDGRYLGVNRAWEDFFGVARDEILGAAVHDLYRDWPAIAARHQAMDDELWASPGHQSYEIPITTRGGRVRHTIYYKATFGPPTVPAGLIGTIVDITDRKRAEQREAIEHAVARHMASSESLHDAIRGIIQVMCERLDWACGARWSLDEGENRLHCLESWSVPDEAIADFLGESARATFVPGRSGLIREVLATGKSVWISDVTQKPDFLRAALAAKAGLKGAFALPVLIGDRVLGAVEFFSREARHPDDWLLSVTLAVGHQIGQLMLRREAESAMREAHEQLQAKARELERSNEELQQFAYVASHDLQEPLRMISSYTQLLERRYGGALEGDAKEFMHYIVDGSSRMKQLIEDLLEYSRVGTRGRAVVSTDSAAALAKALANLRSAQQESGASVTHGELPRVLADANQLAQLFQNLLANAMKFRGAEPPRIHVDAETRADVWVFRVKDNGIGLDPQYGERIFMMFQRLHGKTEYPGTGIGLAICKKIVERHGGRIWVESAPGSGCTFGFTLSRNHRGTTT